MPLRCFNHGDKRECNASLITRWGQWPFDPYNLPEGQERGHQYHTDTHTNTHTNTHTHCVTHRSFKVHFDKKTTTCALLIQIKNAMTYRGQLSLLDFFMLDLVCNLPLNLIPPHVCTAYTSWAQTLIFSVAALYSLSSASSRWLTHACNLFPLHASRMI